MISSIKNNISYIKYFTESPRSFGTLFPSSEHLCNRIANSIDWHNVTRVAEFGAGNGVLTRHLLSRLDSSAILEAWEIQPELVQQLLELQKSDPRLHVVNKSSEKVTDKYDAIFSCLPLRSMPVKTRVRILYRIRNSLQQNGVFIQFQYSTTLEKTLSRYFFWKKTYEILNIPPAWVYICTPVR